MSDLNDLARHLSLFRTVVPRYVEGLKRAGLNSLTAEALVENVDTRTLQSSETPFAGDPVGQNLPYQPGHTPPGAAEREAVLSAAGPFGVVGVANDATHNGTPYGIFIEAKSGLHAAAAEALPRVMAAASPEAWEQAVKAARR